MSKELQKIELTALEKSEIETTFQDADSFREVGEKITEPLDNIFEEVTTLIDKDPIMSVTDTLQKVNGEVKEVYKGISTEPAYIRILKSLPLLNVLWKKLDDARFNMKTLTGQIQVIFEGFDASYNSITTSIDVQKDFVTGIDDNIGKVIAYKEFIDTKLVELKKVAAEQTDDKQKMKYDMFVRNVEFFNGNLEVLIGNLEASRKRLLIRLDSAHKLALSMDSSRPIFKILLSSAVIETSSQKAIDAWISAIEGMSQTIDNLTSDLTDKAIETNKKAEELSSKPILSQQRFVENVSKLKSHFEGIEAYRLEVKKEAEAERLAFKNAREELKQIKTLDVSEQEELTKMIK